MAQYWVILLLIKSLNTVKMLHIKRLFILFFIFLSSLCLAQTQHYFIQFSARFPALRPFSLGGHAFITWRSEDSTLQKEEQFTYGFFPKKGGGIFKNTEGAVVEGYVKNSNRERLVRRFIIEVDSALYFKTLESATAWKTQYYNLFNKNCVDFMNDLALKLNLKTPPTKKCIFPRKPQKYIKLLKKLNRANIVKNTFLEKVRLRILRKAQVETEDEEDD
jgi:hypothetical protein